MSIRLENLTEFLLFIQKPPSVDNLSFSGGFRQSPCLIQPSRPLRWERFASLTRRPSDGTLSRPLRWALRWERVSINSIIYGVRNI